MGLSEEEKLDAIIRRMQIDSSVDAPADAIRYAKNLFRTRQMRPEPTLFERIAAVLISDLEPNRAISGERSAAASGARQMLFESGDNAVDLRISESKKGLEIRGQILGSGFEYGEAELSSERHKVKATLNEQSGFSLSGIKKGVYALTIRGVSSEIYIDKISLN